MIKKFIEYIKESDGSTTSTPGSGTAVSGGASGSYVNAAGSSNSGGDSGSAMSTNSNTQGMGAIKSAQPSSTPGSVWGADSVNGSGDIAAGGNVYTKTPAKYKNKKDKKNKKKYRIGAGIDDLYVDTNQSKVITKFSVFNDSGN
jgi:hypothetical protein